MYNTHSFSLLAIAPACLLGAAMAILPPQLAGLMLFGAGAGGVGFALGRIHREP